MKIKMKLLLLCTAVAPFLMMTYSQQNGNRFGCVCAMEKVNSNEPNKKVPGQEDENVMPPVVEKLWARFDKNVDILRNYDSTSKTGDYEYFKNIYNYVKAFRTKYKDQHKGYSWRDYCFLFAVLEGILESRGLKFDSLGGCIDPRLSKCFPFNEFKNLTFSLWTQLDSKKFRLDDFYIGFAYLMLRFGSDSFTNFIRCLERFRSPYMKLYFASWINLACVLNSSINVDKVINVLLNSHAPSMNCDFVIKSFLLDFGFEKDLHSTLLQFYSTFSKFLNAYSSDYCPVEAVYWFNYLGSLRDVDAINSFVDEFKLYIDDLERELTISDSDCTDK